VCRRRSWVCRWCSRRCGYERSRRRERERTIETLRTVVLFRRSRTHGRPSRGAVRLGVLEAHPEGVLDPVMTYPHTSVRSHTSKVVFSVESTTDALEDRRTHSRSYPQPDLTRVVARPSIPPWRSHLPVPDVGSRRRVPAMRDGFGETDRYALAGRSAGGSRTVSAIGSSKGRRIRISPPLRSTVSNPIRR
jgi:hypothetical protein